MRVSLPAARTLFRPALSKQGTAQLTPRPVSPGGFRSMSSAGAARQAAKALPRLKRLPTLFPNFELRLVSVTEEAAEQISRQGWCAEATFRTRPSATKQEIKGILEGVYGMGVASVATINYEGKKKRGKHGFTRRPDWKKAHVMFNGLKEAAPK